MGSEKLKSSTSSTKMTTLEKALICYRTLIDDLQGRTIFMQDEDGMLRRWTPPGRPIFDKKAESNPND